MTVAVVLKVKGASAGNQLTQNLHSSPHLSCFTNFEVTFSPGDCKLYVCVLFFLGGRFSLQDYDAKSGTELFELPSLWKHRVKKEPSFEPVNSLLENHNCLQLWLKRFDDLQPLCLLLSLSDKHTHAHTCQFEADLFLFCLFKCILSCLFSTKIFFFFCSCI